MLEARFKLAGEALSPKALLNFPLDGPLGHGVYMLPLRRLLILTHNYPPSFTPWCTIGAGRVPIRLRFCPISSFATQELQTILLLTTTQLFFLAMARVIMFSTQKKINKAKREDSVARTSSMRHFNTWGQGGLSWSLRKGSRRARRYDSHLKSQIEGIP